MAETKSSFCMSGHGGPWGVGLRRTRSDLPHILHKTSFVRENIIKVSTLGLMNNTKAYPRLGQQLQQKIGNIQRKSIQKFINSLNVLIQDVEGEGLRGFFSWSKICVWLQEA